VSKEIKTLGKRYDIDWSGDHEQVKRKCTTTVNLNRRLQRAENMLVCKVVIPDTHLIIVLGLLFTVPVG